MKIFFKMILMNIKSQLEYKKAFIISTIGTFLVTFLMTISVKFLFMEFTHIGEWTYYEVLFLVGVVYFVFSLSEMFLRGLDKFDDIIRKGDFDRIMIRPQNLLIQSTSMEFDLSKVGKTVQALSIIIIALAHLQIEWTISKILVFLLINVGLFIIFLGTFILKATFCFWTIEGLEFMNIISEGGKKVAMYPINIYVKWFGFIFTFIFPFGMINYFPVLYIFGKADNWYWGLTPLFTIVYLVVCLLVWRLGVRHYESTGS